MRPDRQGCPQGQAYPSRTVECLNGRAVKVASVVDEVSRVNSIA
jgi:hypothetical protein